MLRVGYLSDENMRKMCGLHQPVPMHRLDLLPRPMENRSGLYSRPLKQPQILSRPATANVMVQATQKLTGRDLSIDYKKALEKEVKLPPIPKTLPPPGGVATPIYGSFHRTPLADISYANLALMMGVPVSGTSLLDELESIPQTESSGFVYDTASVDTPTISETQSEMELREEIMGQYQIRDEEGQTELPAVPQPVLLTQDEREELTPRPPSFIGSEMQAQSGRGRPPTVTVPREVAQQIREFESSEFDLFS